MKSKKLAILTIIALCLSLATVLAPPLASPAQASPLETLHLSVSSTTHLGYPPPLNSRNLNLQPGDEVIQFTRPNLIVGSNPIGVIRTTTYPVINSVSGDLSGTIYQEYEDISVTWDGLGGWKGYIVGRSTFDDGAGNTFSGVFVNDIDTVGLQTHGTAYSVSTSGTGIFSGQVLIGTGSGTSTLDSVTGDLTGTGTSTLRRYSGSEVSGPYAMSGSGTSIIGNVRDLGGSAGPNPNDEFMQFSRNNIVIPKGDPATYIEGGSSSASITSDIMTGTMTQTFNHISLPGTNPASQGLSMAKVTISDASGSITGVGLYDDLGSSGSTHTLNAYMFALKENATGVYADRDFYGTATITDIGGTWSASGSFYTLGQPGVEVPASTGTGTVRFSSPAGTIQNLTAVPESSLPAEGKPDLVFPHGFFEFKITGLTPGETVGMTIALPSAAPVGTQYWKYGPTPSDPTDHWYQIPIGDDDGDSVITITLVDGGLGDDDLTANGVIVDQGGPAYPPSGGGGGLGVGVPVFPSIYIGIAAAVGAGIVAYFVRRRLVRQG
jgi:hypothetical protein